MYRQMSPTKFGASRSGARTAREGAEEGVLIQREMKLSYKLSVPATCRMEY